MSTKGQIVIPAEVRRQAHLAAGDGVIIDFDQATQEIRLRKAASIEQQIDDMSALFTSWIRPGTPPLEDASAFYETRDPRL
jgi:AbrB family looped-hinge helix DNA binding protein